ncbi:MAG: myo-inositol-1-phosphate synthase [Staphylothermus sp.]|nr:myo-inositol-1-phosphate synthase [Staphylothermus sp.]
MVRIVIFGQGLVATHFAIGLERLKNGEIPDYGVPLSNKIPIKYEELEIVGSYDVDTKKIGKTIYDVAKEVFGDTNIPRQLRDVYVRKGIHLDSMKGLPFKAEGLEEQKGLLNAINDLVDEWKSLKPDVFVNVITTEPANKLNTIENIENALINQKLSASQAYAYAVAKYSKETKSSVFINAIPTPIANDPGFVELYKESKAIVLGDDGATGATPLTADLLEHLAERNRKVLEIAQFNIGGNTDFLALDIPERNFMKKKTKSSIVEDILGYNVPNYIKPTGYLPPLGDKKFVAMIIEYISFNNFKDELYIIARINDSPALAGQLVDLARLAKIALDREEYGTIYPINAFYMKNPGPKEGKSIAKTKAYDKLLQWLGIKHGN